MVKKKFTFTFVVYLKKLQNVMVEFPQYLGFLLFLIVLTIGFWLLFFLVAFVQYWIGGALWEMFKEWRAKKQEQSV